jgi:hypothetical protein
MNTTGYLIYQAERGRSQAEQRDIDRQTGELAAATTRRWRLILGSLRLRRELRALDLTEPSVPCSAGTRTPAGR